MRNIIFIWFCCLKFDIVYSDFYERKFVNECFVGSWIWNYVILIGNECYLFVEVCIFRLVINEWVFLDKERFGR